MNYNTNMGFFQSIINFFESIFNSSSPEVQRKQKLRKLETEARSFNPPLFKNGNVLPNFAEAIRILYINTKPLNDLFSSTIGGSDIPRQRRFEAQLVLTGFSPEAQQKVESLLYENRKQSVINAGNNAKQEFANQHAILDNVLESLDNDNFKNIDKELNSVYQLVDLCKFNFTIILQAFDANFSSLDISTTPNYQEVPLVNISNAIEDLYCQIENMQITTAVAKAVLALASLKNNGELSIERTESYTENLKKIAYVITHIIPANNLKTIIRIAKEDVEYNPEVIEYNESAINNFVNKLQKQFSADEQRIKAELKDERLTSELALIFKDVPLATLSGYDNIMNVKLQSNYALSFSWIMPLQILKTFFQQYLTDTIQSLIKNIVIEGFFYNPTYKSEFSDTVYAACDCLEKIKAFEDSFERGKQFDCAVLEGYIRDSHKDSDFYSKMDVMVRSINSAAQKIIQDELHILRSLYVQLTEMLADAKKAHSEIVSNLKVLIMSTRNRDSADLLEKQLPSWEILFEIMRNYTIIK